MTFCSYTYVNRIMRCVNPIRCPTRCYLMLTLENYYANGCKRNRWRSVKLSKRYLRAPAMIERKCNPFNQTFLGKSKLQTCNEFLKFTFEVEINLSPYFITWLISLIHRSMKITYNPWLIIRLHVQTKGYFFFAVIFINRNTAFWLGSKGSKLLKKKCDITKSSS